jgi:hypothetical protein
MSNRRKMKSSTVLELASGQRLKVPFTYGEHAGDCVRCGEPKIIGQKFDGILMDNLPDEDGPCDHGPGQHIVILHADCEVTANCHPAYFTAPPSA